MDPLAIGSLLSGGASLFSALFGGGRPARAPGVEYKRMVADAQAAGFNPLTALMYGATPSYTPDYGAALSRQATIGSALESFSQLLANRQEYSDRLTLDRDYFQLEEQRLGLEQQRLHLLASNPFGPSARMSDIRPAGGGYTYAEVADLYGPLPATVHGIAGAAEDLAQRIGRGIGTVARGAWSLVPNLGHGGTPNAIPPWSPTDRRWEDMPDGPLRMTVTQGYVP